MKLSIITLTFNNFKELEETINSIPSRVDIEKVVINGGSCELTKNFLAKRTDIRSVSEPDRGISDAFNKGIKQSHGGLLIFLNSGDRLIHSAYIDWALEAFRKDPLLQLTHSSILFLDPIYGKLHLRPHEKNIGWGMPFFHQTLICRRRVFDQTGFFDLNYTIAMDYELICRTQHTEMRSAFFSEGPVVEMDGRGVSRLKEKQSLIESFCALQKNKLIFQIPIAAAFLGRVSRYITRSALEAFGLQMLVGKIKKLKHSEN